MLPLDRIEQGWMRVCAIIISVLIMVVIGIIFVMLWIGPPL
jgi:hypothetical protein